MKSYYEILEIDWSATPQQIHAAFRSKSKRWHPDKNPANKVEAEEMSKKINEAHSVLSDDEKRKDYDTKNSLTGIFMASGVQRSKENRPRSRYHRVKRGFVPVQFDGITPLGPNTVQDQEQLRNWNMLGGELDQIAKVLRPKNKWAASFAGLAAAFCKGKGNNA